MSVLVRALPCKDPKLLYAYVKGAPETIKRLCVPETSECMSVHLTRYGYVHVACALSNTRLVELSTFTYLPVAVPRDFLEVLSSLTQQGYRVLALGYKTMHLPWHKAERLHR